MKSTTLHQDVGEFVCIVTAMKNTWSNSRRKRRMEKVKQNTITELEPSAIVTNNISAEDAPPCKKQRVDSAEGTAHSSEECSSSEEKPLITFCLELKLEGIYIKLYLKMMDCEQKDTLNQIMQYFKNRLV